MNLHNLFPVVTVCMMLFTAQLSASALTVISETPTSTNPHKVRFHGTTAIVTDAAATQEVTFYNIASTPAQVAATDIPGIVYSRDAESDATYAYVANGVTSNAISVVSSTDGTIAATYASTAGGSVQTINKVGDYLYLGFVQNDGNGIEVVNISTPTAPTSVTTLSIASGFVCTHAAVVDQYLYLVGYSGSPLVGKLVTVNVSSPSSPVIADQQVVGSRPVSIAATSTDLYIGDQSAQTVTKLSLANPASPSVTSTVASLTATPWSIAVHDQTLFVITSTDLLIYSADLVNTHSLLGVGSNQTSVAVYDADRLFITDQGDDVLREISISSIDTNTATLAAANVNNWNIFEY